MVGEPGNEYVNKLGSIGLAKKFKMLWKNWNKLFVQPRIFPGNCQLMKKKNSSDLVADMVLLVLPLHNQQFYFDVIWEKAVFLISK